MHIVFSTKNRTPFLAEECIRSQMHAYMAGILANLDCPPAIVGGVADHVHVLLSLSRNYSLAKIVRELKRSSSKWIKAKGAELREFHWQNGYGAFSVGQSQLDAVRRYIEDQEAHHKRLSFQDEFRRFLAKYQISYDERYVWD